jgi:phosphoenolpyruvate carboxylase
VKSKKPVDFSLITFYFSLKVKKDGQTKQEPTAAQRRHSPPGDILGQVIRRQAGVEVFELEESIRALAKARRMDASPDIDARLAQIVNGLSVEKAELLSRAFANYFELVNLAEEQNRVRVLRERERKAHPQPLEESVAAAIAQLHQLGVDAYEMEKLLNKLHVELVFTAHPTQAKRRTVLSKLRRISAALTELHVRDLLPIEMADLMTSILAEVTALWLTNRTRTAVITVTDEVKTGLYYMDTTIWDTVPDVYAAWPRCWPSCTPRSRRPSVFSPLARGLAGTAMATPT